MGLAGAGGIGFALGAHFAPGSAALRSALKSVRNQNHFLEEKVGELSAAGSLPSAGAESPSLDFDTIGSILQGGDWKALIPIVLKNPGLLKVGLEAIQGKVGEGQAKPGTDAAGKPAAPAGANYI